MEARPHSRIRPKGNLGKSPLMRACQCLPPDWPKCWIRSWEGIMRIRTSGLLRVCSTKKLPDKLRAQPVACPNLKSRHLKLALRRQGQARTSMRKALFWRHHRWQRTCLWAQIKITWHKTPVHKQIRLSLRINRRRKLLSWQSITYSIVRWQILMEGLQVGTFLPVWYRRPSPSITSCKKLCPRSSHHGK